MSQRRPTDRGTRTRRDFLGVAGGTVGIAAVTAGCIDDVTAPSDGDGGDGNDDGNGDDVIVEDPRVDVPPQDPERPAPDGDEPWEEWDADFLGVGIDAEPSLPFDVVSRVRLADSDLAGEAMEIDGDAYSVRHVGSADHLESIVELEGTDPDRDWVGELEAVDFEERVVVVVESGFGSSSVSHRWLRVEPVDAGDLDGESGAIHLHGYDATPYEQTADVTSRHSVLLVDRPDGDGDLAYTRVSHTVGEQRRVHYNSTEGVVTPDE